jgi:hypothetical protein
MVEVPPPRATTSWRKSCASGETGACVQVSSTPAQVSVRDSKDPVGPVLNLTRGGWAAFLVGVQCGEFDCPVTDAMTAWQGA